jgi:hypothetical protein
MSQRETSMISKRYHWRAVAPAVAIAACGMGAGAASAHHSLAGQFDVNKSFHVSGVVTRVDWVNPHVYLTVDAKAADGKTVTYRFESLPVAMMRKSGLTKQALVGNGEKIEIDAHPARDGTATLGYLLHVKFPDGREFQFAKVPGEE